MKKLRLCLIGSLLATMLFWAAPGYVQAQEQIVHIVQPGENLYRISLRYGVTMEAIMAANGLTNAHRINAGQQLIIPGGADGSPAAEPTITENPYLVQWGDTLGGIALSHGVTIWALMQANEISNSYVIYAGQELVIPGRGSEPAPDTDDTGATPEPTPDTDDTGTAPEPTPETESADTYVVRPGDTLFRIAQQFDTTVGALAYLNGITNPSAIYAGQELRLRGEVPAVTGGGKRILIDLSEQHLYAYQEDQLTYSFVASSGAAPSYTRTGEFHVQSKIPNAYGATWDIWMPHWLGIYWAGASENGIHALPILSNGQTLWAGYLGTPISYGCIVLGTYEAELLYNWAEIGTPVTIQQ